MLFNKCKYSDIENYLNDTTSDIFPRYIVSKLQSKSDKLFTFFKNNHMKANPIKYYFLLSFCKHQLIQFLVASALNPVQEKHCFIVLVDYELRFDEDILPICTKIGGKLLVHIGNFI